MRMPSGALFTTMRFCLVLLTASFIHSAFGTTDNTQLISVIEVPSTRETIVRQPPVMFSPDAAQMPLSVHQAKRANFEGEQASANVRLIADWVVDSQDNGHRPFVIVDKIEAKVFVFDAQGDVRGATPALLGLAPGDDTVPGIGQRELSTIRPEERTTPAGRFVASLDRDVHGQEVLWVDYDAAISMHRVVTSNPKERRLQRLNSLIALERRISYGCINVPVKFYDKVLSPAFKGTDGIVYVLPETHSIREVFASYEISEPNTLEVRSEVRKLDFPDSAKPMN